MQPPIKRLRINTENEADPAGAEAARRALTIACNTGARTSAATTAPAAGWTQGTRGIRPPGLVREAGCLHFCRNKVKSMSFNALEAGSISLNFDFWTTSHPTEPEPAPEPDPQGTSTDVTNWTVLPWTVLMHERLSKALLAWAPCSQTRGRQRVALKCARTPAEGSQDSPEEGGRGPQLPLTPAWRTGAGNSGPGRSALEEGRAASALPGRGWRLVARFPHWTMELLILIGLDSTSRNAIAFSRRLNSLPSWDFRHIAKQVFMKSLCKEWILGIY